MTPHHTGPQHTWVAAAAFTLAVLAAGCASPGDSPVPLAMRTPQQAGLPAAAAVDQALAPLLPTPTDWSLGDPALAGLIERALADHPSLAAAQARARRAQALAGQTEAVHGPQAHLGVDATRQRYTEHGLIPAPVAGHIYNSATAQAVATWAPDFFGQHRAELAAALGQARAAQAEQAAAGQWLAAQVGRAHVAVARALAARGVLDRSLALRQQAMTLVRQRQAAGLDGAGELAQAEAAVRELQGQQAQADEQVALARHQLAVLSAQPPQALETWAPDLTRLQAGAWPTAPSADLLGRRPDVLAARWRVEAAGEEVQGARAQFYPDIRLSAFFGFNALGLDRLLEPGSRQWGVSPALRLPLFEGGRLRAQLEGRQAERDAAVAQYNSLVLDAVREAVDALSSLAALERQASEQAAVLTAVRAQRDLAAQRHSAGLTGRLPLLNAEAAWLAQQHAAHELQARRLDQGLALLKALGGRHPDTVPAAHTARTPSASY